MIRDFIVISTKCKRKRSRKERSRKMKKRIVAERLVDIVVSDFTILTQIPYCFFLWVCSEWVAVTEKEWHQRIKTFSKRKFFLFLPRRNIYRRRFET